MADEDMSDADDLDIEGAVEALDTEVTSEAPADAGASDFRESLDEEVDAVLDEDGPARGPDGKFIAKAETEAPKSEAAPPAATEPVVPVDPFAGYNPFAFKVDGTELALEGIRANDTHVVIPREVWDRQLLPNHLANRESWQQERGQWRQREQSYQQAVQQERERSQVIIDEFNALISDPEKLNAFVIDYERQLPILQAQMRADAAERQLNAQRQQQEQQRAQQDYERVFNASTDAFEQECLTLLKEPAFAVLATDDNERDELLAEIWTARGPQMALVQQDGRVTIDRDQLMQEFQRRAQFIARREAKWKQTTTTEKRNDAALASPATSPQTAPIPTATRKPNGSAQRPVSPRPAPVDRHRITDDDREALRKDFASVFDD